ncbi:MAG: hypothetical protein GF335_03785 [Candidatus Moranbacteria bacterium]|nr:hypothetical protein [Candidatus Moranbacteria bacterium]
MFFLIIFLLGLALGSFLNVVIYRTKTEESIFFTRSKCAKCQKKIYWYDNLPLISYIFLRAKCRHCREPISIQYPLIELATALIFSFTFFKFDGFLLIFDLIFDFSILKLAGFLYLLIFLLGVVGILTATFIYDLKYFIIPNSFVIFGVFLTFLNLLITDLSNWSNIEQLNQSSLVTGLLGAILASGFFLILFIITKGEGIGFGDVKFAIFMGFLLQLSTIMALFLAYLIGALVSIIFLLSKKKSLKSAVPFGPYLCIATYTVWLYSEEIITGYWNLIQGFF